MTAVSATSFECDGCGDVFDGRPEHLAEGLPFRTYCSDGCARGEVVGV